MIRVRALNDGAKNAAIEVVVRGDPAKGAKGGVDIDWSVVVDIAKLNHSPKRIRIDEVHYALSDKVEAQVAWHHPGDERHELFPLGGRGRLAFPEYQPSAPEGDHTGSIEIRTVGLQPGQLVYLLFDLTKQ